MLGLHPMHAYSQDLRDRVLRALERGERPTQVARRFEVSRVFVYDVKNRLEEHGERCSRPVGGHRVSQIAPHESQIRSWIKEQPDLTLAELAARLAERKGVRVKQGAIWHQLNRWGLSFKKNAARQRARAARRRPGPE